MSKKASASNHNSTEAESGISRISVSGYKSIRDEQSIEVKPLTILAGANNSGKSSMMQPLLLLKQTLEATYDPGPLLLNGPNVHFTSLDQLLARSSNGERVNSFEIGIGVGEFFVTTIAFRRKGSRGLQIEKMIFEYTDSGEEGKLVLEEGMKEEAIFARMQSFLNIGKENTKHIDHLKSLTKESRVIRNRCFLDLVSKMDQAVLTPSLLGDPFIHPIIHLPGLRGNPERTFPVTAIGSRFPGTFPEYTASIIAQWQVERRSSHLRLLGKYLEKLGLTWKVTAKAVNDTQVELQVSRLPRSAKSGAADMVNIADVGVGVSQVLPVLVALLVAEPGQLVYIEEPEIHLHPRAQSAMAEILADAAKRGVRVVIETHSQLLLLGVQTLVAQGKLSPDLVKLHWFQRRKDGSTQITSADLDEAGAFGNWPEDFAEVALEAESRYLDAAESRQTIN